MKYKQSTQLTHGYITVKLDVPRNETVLDQSRFEGKGTSDKESDCILLPFCLDILSASEEFPV